jgi:hypothetical protein
MPVDELLKGHLKIDGGLVVQDVVPDSPAAIAGVQKHDILLKFNDASIQDVESLAAAIAANGDAEGTMKLLRAGTPQSIKIKPSSRPQDVVVVPPVPRGDWGSVMEWLEKLRSGQGGQGSMQMWIYPPGIALPEETLDETRRFQGNGAAKPGWLTTLPQGTSVTITKPGDQPAQIVVKRGEETWQVDENQLDQLPEELREPVREMLQPGVEMVLRPGDLPRLWREFRPAPTRPRLKPKSAPEQPADAASADESQGEYWGRRFEEFQERFREHQQRLEEEINRLRRDLEQRAQPDA